MARKKKEFKKEEKFEEIASVDADDYCTYSIPEGATDFKLEIDTSCCYYESDCPSYKIHFFKKK